MIKKMFLMLIISMASIAQLSAMDPSQDTGSIRDNIPASIGLSGSKKEVVRNTGDSKGDSDDTSVERTKTTGLYTPQQLGSLIEKYVDSNYITPEGRKKVRNAFAHRGFYQGKEYTSMDERIFMAQAIKAQSNLEKKQMCNVKLEPQPVVSRGKEEAFDDEISQINLVNTEDESTSNTNDQEKDHVSSEKTTTKFNFDVTNYVELKHGNLIIQKSFLDDVNHALDSLVQRGAQKFDHAKYNAFVSLMNQVNSDAPNAYEGDSKYAQILQDLGLINTDKSISNDIVAIILSRFNVNEKGQLLMYNPIKRTF